MARILRSEVRWAGETPALPGKGSCTTCLGQSMEELG
jgi:hypothetical protein